MRKSSVVLILLVVVAASSSVQASVITSAIGVTGPPSAMPIFGASWMNTINQTGLSIGYTSGVTDFDAYAAMNPTHIGTTGTWGVSITPTPAAVDYDLGASLEVSGLAFWQYPFDDGAVASFDVLTSNDASFASFTLVGSFVPLLDGTGVGGPGASMQIFDLLDTNAQFVRLNITSTFPTGVGFSEVAFDIEPSDVPEPGTLVSLALGLGVLGLARRRHTS